MKRLLIVLLMGFMLNPAIVFGKHYKCKRLPQLTNIPIRMPARQHIDVSVDDESGNLLISANYDVGLLAIKIERNGVLYEESSAMLVASQVLVVNLDSYEEGAYAMTLSNPEGMEIQYEIVVEDE